MFLGRTSVPFFWDSVWPPVGFSSVRFDDYPQYLAPARAGAFCFTCRAVHNRWALSEVTALSCDGLTFCRIERCNCRTSLTASG
jgi:hypothetical protein